MWIGAGFAAGDRNTTEGVRTRRVVREFQLKQFAGRRAAIRSSVGGQGGDGENLERTCPVERIASPRAPWHQTLAPWQMVAGPYPDTDGVGRDVLESVGLR